MRSIWCIIQLDICALQHQTLSDGFARHALLGRFLPDFDRIIDAVAFYQNQ